MIFIAYSYLLIYKNKIYEKLDITEEEMLFLYTNADCLPNKLHELKQLIVQAWNKPRYHISYRDQTQT